MSEDMDRWIFQERGMAEEKGCSTFMRRWDSGFLGRGGERAFNRPAHSLRLVTYDCI